MYYCFTRSAFLRYYLPRNGSDGVRWRLNHGKGLSMRYEEKIGLLFHKMLSEYNMKDYANCVNAKDKNFSSEVLYMTLIFEQQKIINNLIRKLQNTAPIRNATWLTQCSLKGWSVAAAG